ncbi:MAG: hypothetical protein ACREAG_07760 [Nitrosopumilaceae archaeon]
MVMPTPRRRGTVVKDTEDDINRLLSSPSPTNKIGVAVPPALNGVSIARKRASLTLNPLGTFSICTTSPDEAAKLKGPPVIEYNPECINLGNTMELAAVAVRVAIYHL